MWKCAILVTKADGLDDATFDARWRDGLVPAIKAALHEDNRLARMKLNVPPTQLSEKVRAVFPRQFDGMLELWFASREDAVRTAEGLAEIPALRTLAAGTVVPERSVVWLSEEVPCKADSGSRVKFLAGGQINEAMTLEEAQEHYRTKHPQVAKSVPETWNMLTLYTQFHGRNEPRMAVLNWLAQYRFVPMQSDMGFADADDFIEMYTHPAYLAIIRPDEEKFGRPGDMLTFITGEERVLIDRRAA